MTIKPTVKQTRGFLGTLLASIGIPMLHNAISGKGAPRVERTPLAGGAAPQIGSPPWSKLELLKKEPKESKRSPVRTQQPNQVHPTSWSYSVRPKFHKNISLSNWDLLEWSKYLKIPIRDISPRDTSTSKPCSFTIY